MQNKYIERYFFFGLLLVTLFLTFLIFQPFILVLILGASFATVLHPIYRWLVHKKLPTWLAALLTVLFFMIVLCIPFISIGAIVFNQAQNVYHSIVLSGNSGTFIHSFEVTLNKALPQGITIDVNQKISNFLYYISSNIATIFSNTLSVLLSFILMFISVFYFLKDGTHFKRALIVLSPLSDIDDEKILTRLSHAINGVIKGYLLIALVQGLCMWFGLWLFGVPNPALWGVITCITSLIPTIGTALISVPAMIFLFATGHSSQAFGLAIWATTIVGTIDNVLSPYVISGKVNIPPFLICFAVLGGITLFGPVGILIGPLTISLLYTLVSIYRNEYRETIV